MAKTSALVVRFTDDEKAALKALSESCGVSVSALMRRIAREAVSHGPEFFVDDRKHVVELTRALSSIGRNVNQIARKVNSGQCKSDPLSAKQLNGLSEMIETTRQMYLKMLENAQKRRILLRAAGRREKP